MAHGFDHCDRNIIPHVGYSIINQEGVPPTCRQLTNSLDAKNSLQHTRC